MVQDFFTQLDVLYLLTKIPTLISGHTVYCTYTGCISRLFLLLKIDKIEMNIKILYRLVIFAIVIEILIFEIVLMRACREKRSSRSRCSPAQYIKHWQEEKRVIAQLPALPLTRLAASRQGTRVGRRNSKFSRIITKKTLCY